jgi:hypothetical protein
LNAVTGAKFLIQALGNGNDVAGIQANGEFDPILLLALGLNGFACSSTGNGAQSSGCTLAAALPCGTT